MNIQEIASASAQVKELITPLAEQIGEAGEHVYGVFLKQVYVIAFRDLISGWAIGLFGLGWIVWGFKLMKKKWGEYSDDEKIAFVSLFILLMILEGIAVLGPLNKLIQVSINPEYAAIELIIKTFRVHP